MLQVFGQWALPEEGPKQRDIRKQRRGSAISERTVSQKDGIQKGEKTSMSFQARHAPTTIPIMASWRH